MLGDLKFRPLKVLQQFQRAIVFLRQNRRHLLEIEPRGSEFSEAEARPGSA